MAPAHIAHGSVLAYNMLPLWRSLSSIAVGFDPRTLIVPSQIFISSLNLIVNRRITSAALH